jgi:acid phosphatase
MKKNVLLIFGLVINLFFVSAYAQEPTNITFDKQTIARYHDSGEYDVDIQNVVDAAESYLNKRVDENNQATDKKKLALVFDIDETTLSNYPSIVKLNFGGTLDEINSDIANGTDAPIPETLSLYKDAIAKGVAVFFITGRDQQTVLAATEKNLKTAGYTQWQGLFLRPHDYKDKSIIPFKSSVRKKLEEQGYDVVENIGDQYSDLAGGYTDATYKLPNPFYYIP